MKKFASFLAVMIAVLSGVAWLIARIIPGELVSRSVWASVAVAVIVQAVSFGLMRLLQPVNVMAGYALGFILRVISLVASAFMMRATQLVNRMVASAPVE